MQSRILNQLGYQNGMVPQNGLHLLRSHISTPKPDDLGRHSVKSATLCEVAVLGYDAKIVVAGILPNLVIGSLVESPPLEHEPSPEKDLQVDQVICG